MVSLALNKNELILNLFPFQRGLLVLMVIVVYLVFWEFTGHSGTESAREAEVWVASWALYKNELIPNFISFSKQPFGTYDNCGLLGLLRIHWSQWVREGQVGRGLSGRLGIMHKWVHLKFSYLLKGALGCLRSLWSVWSSENCLVRVWPRVPGRVRFGRHPRHCTKMSSFQIFFPFQRAL